MIGYYAHGHGSGHCNYAGIFAKELSNMVIFTDRRTDFCPSATLIRLDNENLNGEQFNMDDYPAPPALHYAPIALRKITVRNTKILKGILEHNIRLMIVDVSVEIAMLCRVSSIPYAYVRLHGERTDAPHINAFKGATFLLAYYPEAMEAHGTPEWIKRKTIYLGFISKYRDSDNGTGARVPLPFQGCAKKIILHIAGFGGNREMPYRFDRSKFKVFTIGPVTSKERIPGVTHLGTVNCIRPYVAHADAVLAACGSNLTSELLTLGKRFIAVVEKRHFDEHILMAKMLAVNGFAIPMDDNGELDEAVEHLIAVNGSATFDIGCTSGFVRFVELLSQRIVSPDRFLEYVDRKLQNHGSVPKSEERPLKKTEQWNVA